MEDTCRKYQKEVQPFINHELKDPEMREFLEHIKTCKKCADELETYFIVDYSLRYLDQGTARSYDIRKLLTERIREDEHDLKIRRIFRVIVPVGMILLIAITVIMILSDIAPDVIRPVYERILYFIEELWRIK